jgi:hypothetical protein
MGVINATSDPLNIVLLPTWLLNLSVACRSDPFAAASGGLQGQDTSEVAEPRRVIDALQG